MITPHHAMACIATNHYCVCNLISIINNNIMSPNYISGIVRVKIIHVFVI